MSRFNLPIKFGKNFQKIKNDFLLKNKELLFGSKNLRILDKQVDVILKEKIRKEMNN